MILLFSPPSGSSSPVVPEGGLLSLEIVDDTPIEPVSNIGPNGTGWVAIVTLKGITDTGGTVVPSALTIEVSDPGYTVSGGNVTTTTVTRTITGVAQLREPYPNGATKVLSTDGTDLFVYVTLDDPIYANTTIVSAEIGDTFYTDCVASEAGTKTNNSEMLYRKPLFGWLNPQQEITGPTHDVESYAFHGHAQNGQQVAAVVMSVSDGTHTSDEVVISAPALSVRQTVGNIAETWQAQIDMSEMDDNTMCEVNAVVYPWLGDSSAVLNVDTDGAAWPTSLPITPLRVYCDSDGDYGTAYAYVDGVGAGTPAVSSNPATAKANPYASINAALTAIAAWNNANRGHNDLGAAVCRLMDNAGGDATYNLTGDALNSPGATWYVIEKDPDSSATITFQGAGVRRLANMVKFRNLRIDSVSTSDYTIIGYNASRSMVCLENCTTDNTDNKQIITWFSMKYLLNCTHAGSNVTRVNGLPDATCNFVSAIGCVTSSNNARYPTADFDPHLMVGCNIPLFEARFDADADSDGEHGRIFYNNRCYNVTWQKTSAYTLNHGIVCAQNIIETLGAIALNRFADGDVTSVNNLVEFHNTAVGERCSVMYNDVVATQIEPSGRKKYGRSCYNIWANYNWKGDTFNSAASIVGSVGTWAYAYSVGNHGNVSLFGAVGQLATDLPHNDNTDTPYMGMAWLADSQPNLGRTSLGFTKANIMDMFQNFTASPRAVPALGGDYQPLMSSNYLSGRVPAGHAVFGYDIEGNPRLNDGGGAAGAYEVEQI